jgi:hypothetical protein
MVDDEHAYEALPQRTHIRSKRGQRHATLADWPAADAGAPEQQQQQQEQQDAVIQSFKELKIQQQLEEHPQQQQQQQQQQHQQNQQQEQQHIAGVQAYRSAAVGQHKFECERGVMLFQQSLAPSTCMSTYRLQVL